MLRGFRFQFFRPKIDHFHPTRNQWLSEFILCTILLLVGLLFFIVHFFSWIVPVWEFSSQYVSSMCTIKEVQIASRIVNGKEFFRPEILIAYRFHDEDFTIRTYEQDTLNPDTGFDFDRETAEAIAQTFVIDREYPCLVNKITPSRAILHHDSSLWGWFFLIIPVFLIMMGGTGLYIAVKKRSLSAERMVRIRSTPFSGFVPPRKGTFYPTIPDPDDMNDSPGTYLAYRLQMTQTSTIKIILTLILCLFWNAVSWTVLLLSAFSQDLFVQTGLWGVFFGIVLCLLGVVLLIWIVHQFLIAFGIGPTILEVSDLPVYSGRKYRLMLLQFGTFRVKHFQLNLVCEEIVRFRQGTDTITTRKDVVSKIMYEKSDFETQSDTPLQEELILHLPLGSMHSFRTEHNEILWKLVVDAEFAGWPKIVRTFPLIVRPAKLFGFQVDWDTEI